MNLTASSEKRNMDEEKRRSGDMLGWTHFLSRKSSWVYVQSLSSFVARARFSMRLANQDLLV